MKPVTVIIGPIESGKTTLLKKMAFGKKYVLKIDYDHNNAFLFSGLTHDTEIICIDDSPGLTIEYLKQLATQTEIFVMRPYKNSLQIERPEIVITSCKWSYEDIIDIGLKAYQHIRVIDLYDQPNN